MNDLLMRMRVRRHLTPGGERGKHLIHRLAVRDRAALDAWANFNCRSFWFHFRTLRHCVSRASLSSDRAQTSFAPQPLLSARRGGHAFRNTSSFRGPVLFAKIIRERSTSEFSNLLP